MKNLKTQFLTLALLVGVSGAFLTKATQANASKRADPVYRWSSSSIAPQNPSQTNFDATVADAVDHFGCQTGSELCASGNKISGAGASTAELDTNP